MTLEAKDSTQDVPQASEILSGLKELKAEIKDLRLEIRDQKEQPASEKSMRMEKLEEEVKSLKLEIEKLMSSEKPVKKAMESKRDEIVFDWDLEGAKSFLKETNGYRKRSPIFYAAGVPWSCYCEIKEEQGKKGKKFFGFYLRNEYIDEAPGTWSVNVIYELRLLSPSDKLIKSSRYSTEFKRSTAFGVNHFFSCNELKKRGLIAKDRIKFQIYLTAIKQQ